MSNTAVLERRDEDGFTPDSPHFEGGKRPPPASTVKDGKTKRWWSSDLHIGHANIIEYCPERKKLIEDYVTKHGSYNGDVVGTMTEAIIERWNETVAPNDDVMLLGDLCMGKLDESLPHVKRLNGKKKLVPGNHDRCWAFARNKTPEKRKEWEQKYRDVGLELWPEQITIQVGDHLVMLCHFPYRGDSHDTDRYQFARPFDEGRVLICGHVHDSWAEMDNQINVGLDVRGYKPIDDAELIRLIEKVS